MQFTTAGILVVVCFFNFILKI